MKLIALMIVLMGFAQSANAQTATEAYGSCQQWRDPNYPTTGQFIPITNGNVQPVGSESCKLTCNPGYVVSGLVCVGGGFPVGSDFNALVKAKIRTAYLQYLGREPEAAGMLYWQRVVILRIASIEQVVKAIQNSLEANIRRAYLDHLGREPDAVGMHYWHGVVTSGAATLAQVVEAIKSVPEAKKYTIKKAYQLYRNRTLTEAQIDFVYWMTSFSVYSLEEHIEILRTTNFNII